MFVLRSCKYYCPVEFHNILYCTKIHNRQKHEKKFVYKGGLISVRDPFQSTSGSGSVKSCE